MRILVVDPDDEFARGLAKKLAGEGHVADPVMNPGQLEAQLRIRPADVIVIDLSRRRMNGFEVARSLRNQYDRNSLEIILTSPKHQRSDAEIQTLMRDTGAALFYSKPVDQDRLVADLSAPRSTGDAGQSARTAVAKESRTKPDRGNPSPKRARAAPRVKAEISWDNAKAILRIWSERQTGKLVLVSDSASGTAAIVEGGLVVPEDRKLVRQALLGGTVAFREDSPDGIGNWAQLGSALFKGVCAGCEAKTMRRYLHAVPVRSSLSDLCRSLPISGESRKVMGQVNGTRTFGEILDRAQVASGDVSIDFEALVQLGLLSLKATGDEDHAVESASGDSRVDGDINALPTMGAASVANAHRNETPDQIQVRLERELSTIEGSTPAVVLGIPADADVRLVDAAAARMRDRYARIIADASLPDDVRNLAQQVAVIVDRSHRTFDFGATTRTGQVDATQARGPISDLERLLEEGRSFIGQSEWTLADKTLTEAHEHQLDHAQVLANLGWARLHNPARDMETRTVEGRDFLLLAEQFDPRCAEGQYYLAQVLFASGQLAAAEQRAKRAAESAPDDPARAALHRKMKMKLAASAD